jgi:thermospermine synthase
MAKWIIEDLEEGLRFSYKLSKLLASTQSKFQQVDVCETEPFGRVLIIDGLIQSSQLDEHIYHECLVHPAMLAHATGPKRVFIGGGGEGSTAREVLRHKSVEKCVMVDIDGDVVDFCKAHLPENAEAFADPRLDLVIDDCKVQLEKATEKFDVIIMDLDDPLEGGPCYWLYCKEFYEMCKSKLNPGGILVTQASGAGIKQHKAVLSPVLNTLKQVFPACKAYKEAIYSFADQWGFVIAHSDPKTATVSTEEVDNRIAARIKGELKFLDGESYTGAFCLSKELRKTFQAETRVLSKDIPAIFLQHMEGVSKYTKESDAAESTDASKRQRVA